LNKKDGLLSKLTVRVLEKPFKEFPNLNAKEKIDYGHVVYYEDNYFYEVLDGLFLDMESVKEAVNS